ncbi:SapC family protein [Pseudomonas sp. OV226]|uniref:SapC family protein n=1 Tax=Pseudomonas sp. OV226 TaxID=2135588 RepID=UPI000D6D7B6E|nr:SapC family protein [Pseudomonas sp. OV226]PWK28773.1 SapC protein [Pseudomonas sp. OV226]
MSNLMLLYKNVQVLSRETHKGLRLKEVNDCSFAANTHWMPVAGAEFYAAARNYPVVFVSELVGDAEQITPIILVGLEAGRNDFVDSAKQWAPGVYVPAFVRRYPFVLGSNPGVEGGFTVLFDEAFSGLNNLDGRPLFNEDGTNAVLLDEVLGFMNGFNEEMERTRMLVAQLQALNLLEKRSAQIRAADGAAFEVQDFLVINEEKLSALTGEQLADMNQRGFLGLIFAHLMSLANLPQLLDRHRANKATEEVEAVKSIDGKSGKSKASADKSA